MLLARLRQWSFPSELRVDARRASVELMVASALLGQVLRPKDPLEPGGPSGWDAPSPAPRPDAVAPADPDEEVSGELPEKLAVALATQYFRLARSHAALVEAAGEGARRELRAMARHLRRLDELMRSHQVESLDLTGEAYTEQRRDFEPVGEPTRDASRTTYVISFCEQPAVRLYGRLVQRARGSVTGPA